MIISEFLNREPYEFIKKIFKICNFENKDLTEYDNWKLEDIENFGFNYEFISNYINVKLNYIGIKTDDIHQALYESCLFPCFVIDKSLNTDQIERLIDISVLTTVYDDYIVFKPKKFNNLLSDLLCENQNYNINKYYKEVQNDCLKTLQTNFLKNEFQKFWNAVPESYIKTIIDKPNVDTIKELHNIKRPITFSDVFVLFLIDENEIQNLDVQKLNVFYKLLDITYYLTLLINDFASYEKEYFNNEYDNSIFIYERKGMNKNESFNKVILFFENYNKELSFVKYNEIFPNTGKRLYNYIKGNVLYSKYTLRYKVFKYDINLEID